MCKAALKCFKESREYVTLALLCEHAKEQFDRKSRPKELRCIVQLVYFDV